MSSDRPPGHDEEPRSTDPMPEGTAGAGDDWNADDAQAWDEPDIVRSGDAHGRESRDWRGARADVLTEHGYHDEHEFDPALDQDGYAYDEAHPAGLLQDSHRRAHRPLWRRLLVYALALGILAGGVGVGWAAIKPVYQHFTAAKDFEGPGSGAVTVVVEPGDTGLEIGSKLANAGVVLTADAFARALDDKPGDEIQPGHYRMRNKMSAAQALSLLRSGARDETRVTLREGLWKSEVFDQLSKATGVPLAEYTKAEAAIRKDPSLVGLPASAKGAIEGYLFPATYAFDPGTTATVQLRQMVTNAMKQLRSLGVSPGNMERIVTIASLVESSTTGSP
ncbi:MAG: endolytic transglycosylase MltG [Micrococcales bacterium]|nr:endolytic transglycosylase MltG [Micrococcales bacterium]